MSIGLFGLDDESTGQLAPPPAGQLVTADEARAALGEAFAARPDLARRIQAASESAEDYCNRSFAPKGEVEEYHDGAGRPALYLRRPPVASVASVAVNGVTLDNSAGREWQLDPDTGELFRGTGRGIGFGWGGLGYGGRRRSWPAHAGPVWPVGYRNVLARYTGGFEEVPEKVKEYIFAYMSYMADLNRHSGVLVRERIGDYEWQAREKPDNSFLEAIGKLLDRLVIPVVG